MTSRSITACNAARALADMYEHAAADALQLYYTAPGPKQFIPFQGAHNDDIFKISDDYKEQLNKFFQDNNLI